MQSPEVFYSFLQICITPVAMISGVGLLLLTTSNRLARAVDRLRAIFEHKKTNSEYSLEYDMDLKVLVRRSSYLRNSIALVVTSIIFSCLMMLSMFVMGICEIALNFVSYSFFFISILALLLASVYFFMDVFLSLRQFKVAKKLYVVD